MTTDGANVAPNPAVLGLANTVLLSFLQVYNPPT